MSNEAAQITNGHMFKFTNVPHVQLSSCGKLVDLHACVLQIIMFPSKSDGMFVAESLIFRSDSNGEDLEGYAGAGLYDSITMDPTHLKKVDYNGDRCAQSAEGLHPSSFEMDMHVCERGGGGWGADLIYMLLTASKCLSELYLQVAPLIRYFILQFVTAGMRGMATQQQLLPGH